MRPRRIRRIAAGVFLTSALASGSVIVAHEAKAYEPGCVQQFWMVGLRATTRTICDGPVQPDGSWMRARQFYAPAYVTNARTNCYGGGYNVYCTTYPPRQIAEFDQQEVYPVTPQTVLPDEPGHIAEGV